MKTSILKVGRNIVSAGFVLGVCAVGSDTGGCAFEQYRGGDVERVEFINTPAVPNNDDASNEKVEAINEVLDTCVMSMSFESVPTSEVVSVLRGELQRRGINFIQINFHQPQQSLGGNVDPEVTLRVSQVTLRQFLFLICRNSGCVWFVSEYGIDIYVKGDPAAEMSQSRVLLNVGSSAGASYDTRTERPTVADAARNLTTANALSYRTLL